MNVVALPKRRNAPETRARILAAAQRVFAELGYAQAGIREIAAMAGVTSPMLLRYFGSKAGLFEAALANAVRLDEVLVAPREDFGRALCAILSAPDSDITALLMVNIPAMDKEAGPIAARITEAQCIGPISTYLGPPNARARAVEIVMISSGLLTYLRQLQIGETIAAERAHILDWFAGAVQAIVDRN
jgi:AcrR family transcriptional regulator